VRRVHKAPDGPNRAVRDAASWTELRQVALRDAVEPATVEARRKAVRRIFDDRLDKEVVYDALLAEQGHLCVFCECKIRSKDGKGARIRNHGAAGVDAAHWIPLHGAPELALNWSNLYASCRQPRSCNATQKNTDLGFGPPAEVHLERWLHCKHDGTLEVTEACPEHLRPAVEGALGATLGLNHHELRRARLQARQSLRKRLQPWPNAEERRQIALELLRKPDRPPYISVVVHELVREPIDAPIATA
jgi:hypothetical protein